MLFLRVFCCNQYSDLYDAECGNGQNRFFVSLSTLCINVCLNYILIYGNFGAPRLGIQGAAIATLTSRIVETAIMICFAAFADKKVRLKLRDFFVLDRELFQSFVKVGTPVFLSNAIWGLAMSVQTAILGHMGREVIAANSIATTVFQVLTVVTYGAGSASSVLTGKTIGEGSVHKVKSYTITMQVLFLLIGIVTGTALFFCKDWIIQLYEVTEPGARADVDLFDDFIRYRCWYLVPDGRR